MNREKIALMVDTGINVPTDLAKQYHMYTVSLRVIYSDGEYSDGVDITAEAMYERLKEEIPKTSLPSSEDIIKTFDQIREDGYEKLLIVTLSSGLSGTFNLMRMLASEYEGLEIAIIDTKNIAIAAGFNAIQAARYIEDGMGFERLKKTVEENIFKSKVFFCIDTLEYLQKGGRIGLVASVLGTALHLKPIISCNKEGVYYTVSKIRGKKKALDKLMELALDYAKQGIRYNVAIAYGGAEKEALEVKKKILHQLPGCEVYVEGQISPTLGVHTGPGLVGIAIQILE